MTEKDAFAAYRADLEKTERRISREIDPGLRGFAVIGLIFLLIISLFLSHSGSTSGFDVLANSFGDKDPELAAQRIGIGSYLFVWGVLVLVLVPSVLAVVTRRWVFAVFAEWGGALTAVAGLIAIWLRQSRSKVIAETSDGAGVGLFLGFILVIAVAATWAGMVWKRTAEQLALEEAGRERLRQGDAQRLASSAGARDAAAQRLALRAESPRDRKSRLAREAREREKDVPREQI